MSSTDSNDPLSSVGPAKEGIVLDRDGSPLNVGNHQADDAPIFAQAGSSSISIFRGGWGVVAALAIGIPIFLVAGLVIFGVFLAVLLAFGLFRLFFGSGGSGPRGGSRT